MADYHITLSDELAKRLNDYRKRVWSNSLTLSAIAQRAIKDFLDKEESITEKK